MLKEWRRRRMNCKMSSSFSRIPRSLLFWVESCQKVVRMFSSCWFSGTRTGLWSLFSSPHVKFPPLSFQGSSLLVHQAQERLCWRGLWPGRLMFPFTTPLAPSLMRCLWELVPVESGTFSVSFSKFASSTGRRCISATTKSLFLVCRRGKSECSMCHLHWWVGQRRWEEDRVSYASLLQTDDQPAAGWNGWVSFFFLVHFHNCSTWIKRTFVDVFDGILQV